MVGDADVPWEVKRHNTAVVKAGDELLSTFNSSSSDWLNGCLLQGALEQLYAACARGKPSACTLGFSREHIFKDRSDWLPCTCLSHMMKKMLVSSSRSGLNLEKSVT